MLKVIFILLFTLLITPKIKAASLLLPMDESQKNHLKSYGLAYWTLQNGLEIQWLINYRGGSFLLPLNAKIESECKIRGISYEIISDAQTNAILSEIAQPEANMDAIKLEKAPRIAVYSPKTKLPWDDGVTLVLTYAEIPYDIVYDDEIVAGKLHNYDWLHLHHEDFTGQYGKFWGSFRNAPWYREDQKRQEETALRNGFQKVSQLKLFVAKTIKDFMFNGGFLFAMCSATDSYDIALSAENIDICSEVFDGDPLDPILQQKVDYSKTLAFTNFNLVTNPYEYEYSEIDMTTKRSLTQENDFFTLFDFSAKWDPVPTILCQNHTNVIQGFMGQTTSFDKKFIKPNVLILGENKAGGEARYIHGDYGKGTWTFYGGHDPEDYQHMVGDPPTKLDLHPNSPGYRLILNNILFPASKKKKMKT